MRTVRPHLKGCLACKATLREYRAAPARLAGLVPPVVAIGGGAPSLLSRLIDRFSGMGDAAGAKVAAVAASAVVIAGGGAAMGVDALHHDPPAVAPSAFAHATTTRTASPAPSKAPSSSAAPDPNTAVTRAISEAAAGPPAPRPESQPQPAAVDALPEFDPGTADPPGAPAASDPIAADPGPAPAGSAAPSATRAPSREPGEFGP